MITSSTSNCAGLLPRDAQVKAISFTVRSIWLILALSKPTLQMSRSLDKGLKEALKHGDHDIAYLHIADALQLRVSELLDVEFLGPSHALSPASYLLRDGNALAIPKLSLVQAFIPARKTLKRYCDGEPCKKEALRATAVILLMDPEHLTAANTRKRILLQRQPSGPETGTLLQNELYLIDSLLTSRLHRHTKSPTLWGHRQWLLERGRDAQLPRDMMRDLTRVVFVSAERHPRNYYAWSHARYLMKRFSDDKGEEEDTLVAVVEKVKKWCFSHHNDISGWSFLIFALAMRPELAQTVFTESLQLAKRFRWRNESVWCFLRSMLLGEWVQDSEREQLEELRISLLDGADDNSQDKRVLEQAKRWIAT